MREKRISGEALLCHALPDLQLQAFLAAMHNGFRERVGRGPVASVNHYESRTSAIPIPTAVLLPTVWLLAFSVPRPG